MMCLSFSAQSSDKYAQKVTGNLVKDLSGYTQVKVDTGMEQKYPMLKVTSLKFPNSTKYIGQALNYALSFSGYELEDLQLTNEQTLKLYSLKLPLTNRAFVRSTTLQIIETIVGSGFEVALNEERRVITINPKAKG